MRLYSPIDLNCNVNMIEKLGEKLSLKDGDVMKWRH